MYLFFSEKRDRKKENREINMAKKIKLILFDFHNVLSDSYFYEDIKKENFELYEKINNLIFGDKEGLVFDWMRGFLSYKEVHKKVSEKINISSDFLDKILIKSAGDVKLNKPMLKFIKKINKDIKICILTDNFDIFEDTVIPVNGLDKIFDKIFSSHKYRKIKKDKNGDFILQSILEMGNRPEETLFIDDCLENCLLMEKIGGNFYHYNNYIKGHAKFLSWFKKNILI